MKRENTKGKGKRMRKTKGKRSKCEGRRGERVPIAMSREIKLIKKNSNLQQNNKKKSFRI